MNLAIDAAARDGCRHRQCKMLREIKGGGRPLCLPQRVIKQFDCKKYFFNSRLAE